MSAGLHDLSTLDVAILAILAIGIARGLVIGLIREGFSIAALGGSFVAVRYLGGPVAAWLEHATAGRLGAATPWIAGAAVGVATIVAISWTGRLLRRGARLAGLDLADRLAGGAVGLCEGLLVAGLAIAGLTWALGRDAPIVEESRSVEMFERLQRYVADHREALPPVASPADWR